MFNTNINFKKSSIVKPKKPVNVLPINDKPKNPARNFFGSMLINGLKSEMKSKTPEISMITTKRDAKSVNAATQIIQKNNQSDRKSVGIKNKSISTLPNKSIPPLKINQVEETKKPIQKSLILTNANSRNSTPLKVKLSEPSKSLILTNGNSRTSTPLKVKLSDPSKSPIRSSAKEPFKVDDKAKDLKSILVDICISTGMDSKIVIDEFNGGDDKPGYKDHVIQVQLKLLKMMTTKIQKERKDRIKIEKQFEDLMEKYSRQMELIDEKMRY